MIHQSCAAAAAARRGEQRRLEHRCLVEWQRRDQKLERTPMLPHRRLPHHPRLNPCSRLYPLLLLHTRQAAAAATAAVLRLQPVGLPRFPLGPLGSLRHHGHGARTRA